MSERADRDIGGSSCVSATSVCIVAIGLTEFSKANTIPGLRLRSSVKSIASRSSPAEASSSPVDPELSRLASELLSCTHWKTSVSIPKATASLISASRLCEALLRFSLIRSASSLVVCRQNHIRISGREIGRMHSMSYYPHPIPFVRCCLGQHGTRMCVLRRKTYGS